LPGTDFDLDVAANGVPKRISELLAMRRLSAFLFLGKDLALILFT
jgi:hypothetical protein